MGMPLFVPDAVSLYRVQRAANWGYSSYGGGLLDHEHIHTACKDPVCLWSNTSLKPWWNSFNETPEVVIHFQQYSDWEQLPHVQRFASIPGLLDALLSIDLQQVSERMIAFHRDLSNSVL